MFRIEFLQFLNNQNNILLETKDSVEILFKMSEEKESDQNLRKNLFSINKLEYARGERPEVDCILCGVKEKNEKVPNLSIEEKAHTILSVNLYPYNPGHLIIFPKRHILNYEELNQDEILEIHDFSTRAIQVLREHWRAQGFNLGYNLGKFSGGSIPHIHLHIVPRYPNEAGYLDVLANTRVVIYEPYRMLEDFKKVWFK